MNIERFRLPQAHRCAAQASAGRLRYALAVGLLTVSAAALGAAEAPATQDALSDEKPGEDQAAGQDRVTDGVELVDGIQRSLEGPDVVIRAGKDRTVYEYRQGGQLRMVKIVPKIGRPYFLVPADQTRGFGDLNQANMLLPQWTIVEF